jgi:hypothetical protein
VGYNPAYPNHRIPGYWSYCSAGTIANPEPDKNWQLQTAYAEEGKYKKVVQYYDETLRQRQSQTNLNDEKVTLVGETLYDFEGRQSVNVLAVPATDMTLTYKSGFNLFKMSDDPVVDALASPSVLNLPQTWPRSPSLIFMKKSAG